MGIFFDQHSLTSARLKITETAWQTVFLVRRVNGAGLPNCYLPFVFGMLKE